MTRAMHLRRHLGVQGQDREFREGRDRGGLESFRRSCGSLVHFWTNPHTCGCATGYGARLDGRFEGVKSD